MKYSRAMLSVSNVALGVLAFMGAATAGVPYPTAETPDAVDQGALTSVAAGKTITVTVALKLSDPEGAEALFHRINNESDPEYHKFLTAAAFDERFGPKAASVAKVRKALERYGLTVERASSTTLHVTGTPAQLEQAFSVKLHQFSVPAHGASAAYSFHAPLTDPTLPDEIKAHADLVLGLDDRPAYHPNSLHLPSAVKPLHATLAHPNGTTPPDDPGLWTVKDFADYYNVNPLYANGITGKGRTLAIVTLAAFTDSDAFTYWKELGLTVSSTRLTTVEIDGGPGAPSDDSGSGETTLDVEQSGGIAPGANIIVYEAPNTNQAFLDAFAKAIDANTAESISTSWGSWEWYNNVANAPVTSPTTGKTVGFYKAAHILFVKAGVQGQTLFAAAGDAGAYDANDEQDPPDYSLALSVDYPASDPAMTAAGGTTLAATMKFTGTSTSGKTVSTTVTVPEERVWSWDYLVDFCADLGYDPSNCGILAGGGGGVSIIFPKPGYQDGISGIQKSQKDQVLLDEDTVPVTTEYVLPGKYAGRNVPDVSLNADPDTGYIIDYTSSSSGYGVLDYYGGTSFVAPQLNGVIALYGENSGKRFGLINTKLYNLTRSTKGYTKSELNYITEGNNLFYTGRKGYSPAVGVGTINVSNLAAAFDK